MFERFDQSHYLYSVDFRRQIKARAMKLQIPSRSSDSQRFV